MMMLMQAMKGRQKKPSPQGGPNIGSAIPALLPQLFGGGNAGPAMAPIIAGGPAPAVMPSLSGALSSGGGLSAGSTMPTSALGTTMSWALPLAAVATAPMWAPKLGSKLTSFFKGKDNDRRFDVNEVVSPLKSGGKTQFQKAVPNWDSRSEDERKNIAQKAYDLKVLNLIGDPSEDMGLMGDARNPNSEQMHIGSKLMSFDRKMSRGEEPKWKLRQDMERIPTADEILHTGSLKKDYREKLAEFASMLTSGGSPTPGPSIDPGFNPQTAQGLIPLSQVFSRRSR